ncbi:MAG: hypothetical protein ACD_60C00017G0005 [uncultured bacterium]|nr:MAG: hypothetical protein ACD_60C00017G0005 [uncultured bacterium]
MSKDHLPLKVDPYRFADNGIRLDGVLWVKEMQRFSASLSDDSGEVSVQMAFEIDEQGIRYLKGHLAALVMLQCQRCLDPFKHEIISNFLLGIVHTTEEAEELPNRYDPLIVVDDTLILRDMIEEELIISLPIVAMHHTKDCNAEKLRDLDAHRNSVIERENPFKVIELLRKKRIK